MKKTSSYKIMKDYFANLVEQSTFLNDFAGYFSRELHNKQGSYNGVAYPCLALFGYNIDVEGEQLQSSAVRSMNFGILIGDVPAGDYEEQYQTIDKAEQLAMKVIARMRFDSNNPAHFLYGALQKNTVEIRPIELEGVGLFGVEVSFKIKNIQSFKLNPDDWEDIDKVC